MKRKPLQRSFHSAFALAFSLSVALVVGSASSCGKMARPDDAAITTDIKAKMFSEPALKVSNVDVSSRAGEVTLTGQVQDDSARLEAYKIATEAKGVTKVNDQMRVLAPQAATPPRRPTSAREFANTPVADAKPVEAAGQTKAPRRKTIKPTTPTSPAAADNATGAPDEPGSAASAPMAQPAMASTPAASPPPQPRTVTVPSGAIITVRTMDPIDSSVNTTGRIFKASLDAPIVVDDHVVVPKGADTYMKLESASSAGKFAGKSELTLALQSVVFQGKTYNVATSDVKQSGTSRGKDSAVKIGGGAALGALIGGLAGGGKGAAIGAAVGGGAGTGVQVFTKGKQVKIPSETRLDFTLQQPFDITYIPTRKSQRPTGQSTDQPGNPPTASSDQPPSSN